MVAVAWCSIGVARGEAAIATPIKSICLEGYGLYFHRHKGKTKHKLPNYYRVAIIASPPS
jgi:hypothetical protein